MIRDSSSWLYKSTNLDRGEGRMGCLMLSLPPIVVVEVNDTRLNFSSPLDQDFKAFNHSDAQMLRNEGLVAIWTNTTMTFDFNGTGIAVVGLTQTSFPPVPTKLLPSFKCTVDDEPTDPLESHHNPLTHPNATSDIPTDGKQIMCRKKNLRLDRNHTLTVKVTVSDIPAFIDSVRFRPPLPNNGSLSATLNNTILRIDSSDKNHVTFDNRSWEYNKFGHLTSSHTAQTPGGFMNITIASTQVQKLDWFGYVHHVDHGHGQAQTGQSLPLSLNGDPTEVPLSSTALSKGPLFRLPTNKYRNSPVRLSIPAPDGYQISLDHVLVTLGEPMVRQLGVVNNTSHPTGSPKPHSVTPAIPIVSGIVGSLVIILVTLFTVRWFEKRRRWRHTWKDSALPSALQHPATRVSSRSSFSREVVTGDIEYNPEAQKKLEGAFEAGIMEPPQALIVHADSGYRVLGVSEVPPHYTRM